MKSPSLSDYPKCDEDVKQLAGELWGDCDGKTVKEHALGKGKIVWGPTPEETLAKMGVPPDFTAGPLVRWIHRSAEGVDIYFVACAGQQPMETVCTFRVDAKLPEFWQPETGRIERVAQYEQGRGLHAHPDPFRAGRLGVRGVPPAL